MHKTFIASDNTINFVLIMVLDFLSQTQLNYTSAGSSFVDLSYNTNYRLIVIKVWDCKVLSNSTWTLSDNRCFRTASLSSSSKATNESIFLYSRILIVLTLRLYRANFIRFHSVDFVYERLRLHGGWELITYSTRYIKHNGSYLANLYCNTTH